MGSRPELDSLASEAEVIVPQRNAPPGKIAAGTDDGSMECENKHVLSSHALSADFGHSVSGSHAYNVA